MTTTVTEIKPNGWYAGMLMNRFVCDNGANGECHSTLYRAKMQSAPVVLRGIGRRGFALASMPVEWEPKVGDVITVHESQL